ncbi:OLC1v1015823C1 [Oldenlandia corymbosa var. corymbosa]|uniref:OLC1v1015823C1 n=1 Tax=Oldenlandia corymbosa var. corymbosa TaxID=529605 RepID=A0AAV1E706_OLDCO|nr:OLC1v1015823C1 [Oldenlandia corymbosa var. corymbosa]
MEEEKGHEIVIVGAGIGGLATALALHRKGFKDVVVCERSETLRVEGTAIGINSNGWRALDQLGVGNQLRDKALLLQGGEDVWMDQGRVQKLPWLNGEVRCLKRRDLIDALANALPPKTIRFGCNAIGVKMDPQSLSPVLQLTDDKAVRAKALIGCDGLNSKVADYLGLKPASLFTLGGVRGLTNYPDGHCYPPKFFRLRSNQGDASMVGRIPINDKLVYWFVAVKLSRLEGNFPNDQELIKQETLKMLKDFPADTIEMIKKSDTDSLSFTRLRYRHPWEILVGKFYKGSVAVLGDAMHVMGPFLGQGGSAALEDAVVLARNMGQKISFLGKSEGTQPVSSHMQIEEAFDQYVRERRKRIVQLSLQTYLIGVIVGSTSSAAKFIAIVILVICFRDQNAHSKYDCGKL